MHINDSWAHFKQPQPLGCQVIQNNPEFNFDLYISDGKALFKYLEQFHSSIHFAPVASSAKF